jgi:hypothetical protein
MFSSLVQWTVSPCSVYWGSGQWHHVQSSGAVDSVNMFSLLVQWTLSPCSVYWCSGHCQHVRCTGTVDSVTMLSLLVPWTMSPFSAYLCIGQCHHVLFTGALDSVITFHIKEWDIFLCHCNLLFYLFIPLLPHFNYKIKQNFNNVRCMLSKKFDISGTSFMSHWSILVS